MKIKTISDYHFWSAKYCADPSCAKTAGNVGPFFSDSTEHGALSRLVPQIQDSKSKFHETDKDTAGAKPVLADGQGEEEILVLLAPASRQKNRR